MKAFTLSCLLALLCLAVKAQNSILSNYPVNNGKLLYENVIDAPGLTKATLYANAQQWFVDYFVSAKDVIQNQDKQDGKIIGKGKIDLVIKYNFMVTRVWHDRITIQIDCKDGKYRYKIYNMVMTIPGEDLGSYGYTTPREISDDEIISKLTGNDNSVGLTKKMCEKILAQIDIETKTTIASLINAMKNQPDKF